MLQTRIGTNTHESHCRELNRTRFPNAIHEQKPNVVSRSLPTMSDAVYTTQIDESNSREITKMIDALKAQVKVEITVWQKWNRKVLQ